MPEYKTVGTGITRRERVTEECDSFRDFAEAWNLKFGSWVEQNEQRFHSYEDFCVLILRKAGLPDHVGGFVKHPKGWVAADLVSLEQGLAGSSLNRLVIEIEGHQPDSNVGYSARMLTLIHDLRASKTEAEAVYIALQIGSMWTEWQMKLKWEKFAHRGENQVTAGKKNFDSRTQAQQNEAETKWRPVMERIDGFLGENPTPKAKDMIRKLRLEFGYIDSDRTYYRVIEKVRQASSARRK
jgi:hypothetical protein